MRCAGVLLLTLLAWLAGCSEDGGLVDELGMGASVRGSFVLRFTAAPGTDADEQRSRFEALAAVLEERLNVAAAFVPAQTRQEAVELFRDGEVQLGWFDAVAGLEARRGLPGARVIVRGVEDRDAHSYLIANRSLGLARAADFPSALRGSRFVYGPARSTAGRVMAEVALRRETGEAPSDFFQAVESSASQAETLERVNAGTSDVGALGQLAYDAATPDQKDSTLVIWQTPGYPDYSLSVRPELDQLFRDGFTDDLATVLLALSGEACEAVLLRSGLVAASNEQFAPVEEAMRSLGASAGEPRAP